MFFQFSMDHDTRTQHTEDNITSSGKEIILSENRVIHEPANNNVELNEKKLNMAIRKIIKNNLAQKNMANLTIPQIDPKDLFSPIPQISTY